MQGKDAAKVSGRKTQTGRGARIGNGAIELIDGSSLIHALQIREVEGLLTFVTQNVGVVLEYRGILGQRTRFVHAHHVHGAQRLHGVDVLNDDLLVFKAVRAARQADARDDRQHFGHQTNGRTQGKQQCLRPVAQHKASDHNDNRQHDEHAPYQGGTDALGTGAKLRTRSSTPARNRLLLGNAGEDGCRSLAVDNGRSRANGLPFPLGGLTALARKRRFRDKDLVTLGKGHVDRAEHAGIQADDVAGHKPVSINLNPTRIDALPNGRVVRFKHMAVKAAFGFVLVEQAHQAAHQPHQKEHSRREHARLAFRLRQNVDQKGQTGQCKQQRRKRIEERFSNHRSLFLVWLRLYPRSRAGNPAPTLATSLLLATVHEQHTFLAHVYSRAHAHRRQKTMRAEGPCNSSPNRKRSVSSGTARTPRSQRPHSSWHSYRACSCCRSK